MQFKTPTDAQNAKLIQHMVWLKDTQDERRVLQNRYDLIMRDKNRKCMFVKHGSRITLFTNNATSEW